MPPQNVKPPVRNARAKLEAAAKQMPDLSPPAFYNRIEGDKCVVDCIIRIGQTELAGSGRHVDHAEAENEAAKSCAQKLKEHIIKLKSQPPVQQRPPPMPPSNNRMPPPMAPASHSPNMKSSANTPTPPYNAPPPESTSPPRKRSQPLVILNPIHPIEKAPPPAKKRKLNADVSNLNSDLAESLSALADLNADFNENDGEFKMPEPRKKSRATPARPSGMAPTNVAFVIDGNTLAPSLEYLAPCEFQVDCFFSQKYSGKKPPGPFTTYHTHKSNGHQITFWCGGQVLKWKDNTTHIYFLTSNERYEHLLTAIKKAGVTLSHIKEARVMRAILHHEQQKLSKSN